MSSERSRGVEENAGIVQLAGGRIDLRQAGDQGEAVLPGHLTEPLHGRSRNRLRQLVQPCAGETRGAHLGKAGQLGSLAGCLPSELLYLREVGLFVAHLALVLSDR